jgi:predicted nucleic acid-binding Zn ribbon protein
MRRKKTISLGEALKEYRSDMNIDRRLKEVSLMNSWVDIAGKAIARRTSRVYLKDGKLFIHITSAVVRNELAMAKDSLRERLNEEAGEELVKEIILR